MEDDAIEAITSSKVLPIASAQDLTTLNSRLSCSAQSDNKGFQVSRKKLQISADKLCHGLCAPFRRYCEAAMSMQFDEEPKYDALIALFEPLVAASASQRPITIAPDTIKVIPIPSNSFSPLPPPNPISPPPPPRPAHHTPFKIHLHRHIHLHLYWNLTSHSSLLSRQQRYKFPSCQALCHRAPHSSHSL